MQDVASEDITPYHPMYFDVLVELYWDREKFVKWDSKKNGVNGGTFYGVEDPHRIG